MNGNRWVAGWVATTLTLGQLGVATGAPMAKGKAIQRAPKKVAERLERTARARYEAGASLQASANYEGALAEYRAAYDLSKEPRVLRAVAACQKELGRYSEAVATLDQLVAEAKDLEPELREQVDAERAILLPHTALLTIAVDEAGAEVSVDGRAIGTSPLTTAIRVDVGEHSITAKKPAWIDAATKLAIVGGEASTVALAMEPIEKKGHLEVSVSGVALGIPIEVSVDDTPMGAPPWQGDLLAGHHVLQVTAPGYAPSVSAQEIAYKSRVEVEVKLEQDRHEGTLAIDTNDPKSTISLDGRVIGGGKWHGVVPSGGHRLVVARDGYKTYRSDVTVLDKQQRSVTVLLEADGASTIWWVLGGVVLAGAAVGGYFLFKPKDEQPVGGTLGTATIPLLRL